MSAQAPLAGALIAALAAALVHFLWQGLLVGLLLVLVQRDPGQSSPAERHTQALVALLALFGSFGLTLALTLARLLRSPARLLDAGVFIPESLALPTAGIDAWFVGAWCSGVALLASRSLLGFVGVRRLRSSARALEGEWEARLGRLVRAMDVKSPVTLAGSPRVDVPLLIGWLRPIVVLPTSALAGIDPQALEAAIAHELAHLRRRDHFVTLALSLAETLFFYHPVTWWLSREIREVRELASDDLVVTTLGNRQGYARALASLESRREAPRALTLASTGGSLLMRIQRLTRPSEPVLRGAKAGPLAVSCVLLLAVSLAASALAGSGTLSIAWLPDEVARHRALIEESAERHGIDADLVAIVMLVESRGNPDAESSFGALGLMQVMPATAARIAKIRGLPRPTREDLLDPAKNIDLGAWYLAQQARSFAPQGLDRDSVQRIAAAYNAGPGLMRRHLEEGVPLTDESLRYSETVSRLWSRRAESSADSEERGLL